MVSVNMKKLESLPLSKKLPVMQSWAFIVFTWYIEHFFSLCIVIAFVCTKTAQCLLRLCIVLLLFGFSHSVTFLGWHFKALIAY